MVNLGKVHRTISHREHQAQELFDQGLALLYAFNHDEAARSFARAAQIDPTCALCFWGVAYALGPTYNMPFFAERTALVQESLRIAGSVGGSAARPVEQALIAALHKRYTGAEAGNMVPHPLAYADAMAEVANRYSDDFDVQTLYAEALMQLSPFRHWTVAGEPRERTEQIVDILERVLSRVPQHAGANHLYIHALEGSKVPERALPSAGRLSGLVPAVGHLVHKPARIYQRVGRYADAAEINRRAIETDLAYLERNRPRGYYEDYLAHSYGYLAFAASMLGRKEEALEAARAARERMSPSLPCGMPGLAMMRSSPWLVMVRFGLWDEILQESQPKSQDPALLGLWHHAQGMARSGKGQWEAAVEHATAIRKLAKGREGGSSFEAQGVNQQLLLSAKIVDARAAEASRNPGALALWREAVALEDALEYSEPDVWFYPVRHYLGAALLDAGKAEQAEAAFRQDLVTHPNNGWALFGLARALVRQKKVKPAKHVEQAFKEAFKSADIELARAAY